MKGSTMLMRSAASALYKGTTPITPLGQWQAGKHIPRALAQDDAVRRYSTDTNPTSKKHEGEVGVKIPVVYDLHLLESGPPQDTYTSKEELMQIYRDMSVIRRVEITADMVGPFYLTLQSC